MQIVDIHSHFLPEIDDGSKSLEMTEEMLKTSADAKVMQLFVTPHYYPTETADEFLARRDAAFEKLSAMNAESLPELKTGAEVYYHIGLQHEKELDRLCYQGTHCLLLEMPWSEWGERMLKDVEDLIFYRGVTPVIAHLERYSDLASAKMIKRLKSMPVVIQMNAGHIIDQKTRKAALKAIKKGEVDLLGSDAHNTTTRPPVLGEAYKILEESGLSAQAERLAENSVRLWNGKTPRIFRFK